MSATLREIADKAGLAVSTVSHIINGRPQRYSAATRQRVNPLLPPVLAPSAKAISYQYHRVAELGARWGKDQPSREATARHVRDEVRHGQPE